MLLNSLMKTAGTALINGAANSASRALGGNPNAISAGAQAAQGQFNQASANNANLLGSNRLNDQYLFNSAQSGIANDFTQNMWNQAAAWNEAMWEKTAAWNEMMWQKQADFNASEALKNRNWQEKMANTSYQRAMADMEKAGLNPILASGGVSTSAGGGSAATVGNASMSNPTMSGAQGQMASGGLLNGLSASESSYTGQLDYLSGMMGLMGTIIGAVNTALKTSQMNPVLGVFSADTLKTVSDIAGKALKNEAIRDGLKAGINPIGKAIDDLKKFRGNK